MVTLSTRTRVAFLTSNVPSYDYFSLLLSFHGQLSTFSAMEFWLPLNLGKSDKERKVLENLRLLKSIHFHSILSTSHTAPFCVCSLWVPCGTSVFALWIIFFFQIKFWILFLFLHYRTPYFNITSQMRSPLKFRGVS